MRASSWPRSLLLLAMLCACSDTSSSTGTDDVWLTFERRTQDTETHLYIRDEGGYLAVTRPVGSDKRGALNADQLTQLRALLTPDRTASYESDSIEPTLGCDPNDAHPIIYRLQWRPPADAQPAATACWTQEVPVDPKTADLLTFMLQLI